MVTAFAPASAQSLMERRNAIIKGSSEGVVIIEGKQDDNTTGTEPTDPASGEKLTGLRAVFNKLSSPSGCPIGTARNGACPDQGITVPTGEPSSSNTPNFSR